MSRESDDAGYGANDADDGAAENGANDDEDGAAPEANNGPLEGEDIISAGERLVPLSSLWDSKEE